MQVKQPTTHQLAAAILATSQIKPSNQYIQFVKDRVVCKPGFEGHYTIFGAISEIGEVFDLIAKSMRPGNSLDMEKVTEEFGDVLFYFTANLHLFGDELELGEEYFIQPCVGLLFSLSAGEVLSEGKASELIGLLEKNNMDKLNKRQQETGSHIKAGKEKD